MKFLLGLLCAGDIFKGDLRFVFRDEFGPALPEAEGSFRAPLHLSEDKEPEADEEEPGKKVEKDVQIVERFALETEVDPVLLPFGPGFRIHDPQVDHELPVGLPGSPVAELGLEEQAVEFVVDDDRAF